MTNDEQVIWVDDVHPVSGRAAVLEDDGKSCWLYLHETAQGEVLKTVLVYSPIPPITSAEFKARLAAGDTPILVTDYASPQAVITERFPDDFSFRWREDGQAVAVVFRDEILAVATPEEVHGSSRSISRPGPFGDPLEIENYEWLR